MKKILLITFVAGFAFSANAQPGFEKSRDNDHHQNTSSFDRSKPSARDRMELDRRLAGISRDYDNRINDLKHQPFIRAREKRQRIKQLERERAVALEQCKNNYSSTYASGYANDHSGHDRSFNGHR